MSSTVVILSRSYYLHQEFLFFQFVNMTLSMEGPKHIYCFCSLLLAKHPFQLFYLFRIPVYLKYRFLSLLFLPSFYCFFPKTSGTQGQKVVMKVRVLSYMCPTSVSVQQSVVVLFSLAAFTILRITKDYPLAINFVILQQFQVICVLPESSTHVTWSCYKMRKVNLKIAL